MKHPKTTTQLAEGTNFTAVSTGTLEHLNEYNLVLGPEVEIPGKVFAGADLKMTGAEVSLQVFEPNSGVAFLHTHKTHEELYLFVKGKGEFQVDGTIFAISEGDLIRVAPEGKRSVRNNGDEPLIMVCVQYKANSFDAHDATDGIILNEPVVW